MNHRGLPRWFIPPRSQMALMCAIWEGPQGRPYGPAVPRRTHSGRSGKLGSLSQLPATRL